ncbi:hypothetical protein BBOV_III001360 [Babesia bovis T2Bo]|uniref:hypothetical protein n=1 Tax=Babesia bovis T2Bo TaxID=484906 RepID=UPI001C36CFA6|nr:hypothetical protein BBOV_III001360 [Babesia bovis T2Bo]EDO07703.2 hypothetical protein BBOV_III001360 [Babesia bovis T2Bo]
MDGSPVLSFETFLESLITNRILDLNYNDILPRLVASVRASHNEGMRTPFGSASPAGAVFVKAALHTESYRPGLSGPIFKPHEARKFAAQRRAMTQWLNQKKQELPNRHIASTSKVRFLTLMFDYLSFAPSLYETHGDMYWNGIVTGNDLHFAESDGSEDDTQYPGETSTVPVTSQNGDGMHLMQPYYASDQSESHTNSQGCYSYTTPLEGESQNTVPLDSNTVNYACGYPDYMVDISVNNTNCVSDDGNALVTKPVKGFWNTNGSPSDTYYTSIDSDMDTDVSIRGTMNSQPDDEYASADEAIIVDSMEYATTGQKYLCNTSVIFFGGANLITACYYFIKEFTSKSFIDLIAYPDHMRSRHSFILWQNPYLQHICCRELMFALSNKEINCSKIIEILSNKKSKCCILEDFDLLSLDIQLAISKHIQRNDRPFLFLTRNLHKTPARLRAFAFTFRVPSLNTGLLINSGLSGAFCPSMFSGIPRNSIMDLAVRAKDDIAWFYQAMTNLRQKRTVSLRRDTLPLRKLVHYIAFEELNERTVYRIMVILSSLSPTYMHNQYTFWLDFCEEFDAITSVHMFDIKEGLYHIIAEKSTALANVLDPRHTIATAFLDMMNIIHPNADLPS